MNATKHIQKNSSSFYSEEAEAINMKPHNPSGEGLEILTSLHCTSNTLNSRVKPLTLGSRGAGKG